MKKKFLQILAGMALIIGVLISVIVKYDSMLSEKSFYAIRGTAENYSWAVAKFSIQLSEFYSMLKDKDKDMDAIRLKLEILYSRVMVIRGESESTAPLYRQKGYKEVIDSIYNKIEAVDKYVNSPNPDIDKVIELVNQIEPDSKLLSNLADHAEVMQRTLAQNEFKKNRSTLIILIEILVISLILVAIIIAFNIYKLNKLYVSEKLAYKNKNAFIGVLSHELKTSLQAIISTIEVISQKSNGVDIKQIDRLENAAMKMESQMKDVTEFAKLDNGNVEINITPFNLKGVLCDTVSECVSISNKINVDVVVDNVSDVYIKSDPYRIMQVVENLVTNAIKYTDKGLVSVSAVVDNGSQLVIEVADTGQGIPKDKIKSIFVPFTRVGNGDRTPGFGMGLAIVQGIINAFDGSIDVKSEVGKGSVFKVSLPVELSTAQEIEDLDLLKDEPYRTNNINILIVDDDKAVCESLASLLQRDFHVEFTTSPERALDKLHRKPFDLVLSDLQMPIMTGDELYAAVSRTAGPNQKTPFVFISAYENESPVSGVEILTKPVRLKDIRKAIERIFSSKSSV